MIHKMIKMIKDISHTRWVLFLVSSAEYLPPFCMTSFSISLRASVRNKHVSHTWEDHKMLRNSQLTYFDFHDTQPKGTWVTLIVNPENGRTLYESWGTTRCSFQHWCNQFSETIGFFKLFKAHCKTCKQMQTTWLNNLQNINNGGWDLKV